MNYIPNATDPWEPAPQKFEYNVDQEDSSTLEESLENSPVEAVRLVVPITDDPSLVAITFRFWVISSFFCVIGAVIEQYYYYRSTVGTFSIFFVNLASYALGKGMAKVLPSRKITLAGYTMSLNPGPFNIKEHALIGISVSTAANAAYATHILSATDLYLNYRVNALGALLLIITTQSVGYGMAGMLRRFLVYPAEMVWWSNLVHVVLFNALHNTDEFRTRRMVRGWSYMKFFGVVCCGMFIYEFIPQLLAPVLVYFDWICWIDPFNEDFWAIFSSISGGGVLSLSFDWTSIGGSTLYLPLSAQLCTYAGMILNYWILLPIMWVTNTLGTKTFGRPLTTRLFFDNGTRFDIHEALNPDFTLNETKYNAGPPANMTPLYAILFMSSSFISLTGCVVHVICFHGKAILRNFDQIIKADGEDVHTKMMKIYPEVPQLWYAAFYMVMTGLAILTCEVYQLQLPWWGLLLALFIGWVLTLPIGVMYAITGYGPGLNVISSLICGYLLPGRAIANMTFKSYGYMAMHQCLNLVSDLKLGHYMKIPPRSMFVGQFWGTLVGSCFNYLTMTLIINSQRNALNGTSPDPNNMWTGQRVEAFWGAGLVYGALGPARIFAWDGKYGFVFFGFLIGAVVPVIQWLLSKIFPSVQWSKFNISILASGMTAFPNGYSVGTTGKIIVCVVFQYYILRYHKNWWKKYTFILSSALDTGAAFTGLVIFLFLGGGISSKLAVTIPSWWGDHVAEDGTNAPYLAVDRCGAANNMWTGGT
ncbi:hypothetical protein BGZ68_000172 [Mortierella alpina]|nr:hypothetical protein BGZ68_000172 [Mortierella alpina]